MPKSMKERDHQKFLARQAAERQQQAQRRARKRPPRTSDYASREEQHARYLECGPHAWDDRDSGPDY